MRLFFTQLFVSEQKQIAMLADEKTPTRISHRLFATSCSEMRIIMSNIIKRTKGDLKYLFKDSDKLSPKALKRKQLSLIHI